MEVADESRVQLPPGAAGPIEVFVNGVLADGVELPFGGVKRSGFGREMGKFGIEEFVNKKLIRTVA